MLPFNGKIDFRERKKFLKKISMFITVQNTKCQKREIDFIWLCT